jgi:uncharacterized LabA/DUF88 family protein
MAKSKRRAKESERKKFKRSEAYTGEKGDSRYARKRAYCIKHAVWGFEVPPPKPWR